MPNLINQDLVNRLTNRIYNTLMAADGNGDGYISGTERVALPADVRPLADSTANTYFAGGAMPIDAYTQAYHSYVQNAVANADGDGDGKISSTEAQQLPGSVYASVVALQTAASDSQTNSLESLYQQYSASGWNDEKIMDFINQAYQQGSLNVYTSKVWQAVLNPHLPNDGHTGDRFFEALAWYTDKTVLNSGDGALTLSELRYAKNKQAEKYFSLIGSANSTDERRQTWKHIQKLSLLEREIQAQGETYYPYDAAKMMQVNHNNAWNAAHTIESAAEFDAKVRQASYDKPVLVKYGLTYCMHCLLLEQLDSVHAVADKYGDDLDVYKVWWNPNDPAMAEISNLTTNEGVTSSPYFMLYKDGQVVREGYAFPDENGDGVEHLVQGVL